MRQLVLIFGLTILTIDIFACECIPILTLEQHFKKADIVFYAKVISITDKRTEGYNETMHFMMDSLYTNKGGYHPELKILKTIKGNFKPGTLINKTYSFKSRWSLCDIFFKKDSEYIVFGYFDEHGNIQTSVCTPTTAVTDKKMIRRLEKMR
jgi:hypothetical protein